METKFTKGDWKVDVFDSNLIQRASVISYNGEGSVQLLETDFIGNFEEQNANAKLIAAAPDMFNALKDLYDDKEVWSDLFESQQEFICRVLNKATDSNFFKHK